MLKKMKNKTYRNFVIVVKRLENEKGYDRDEAAKLAHLVFDNFDYDKDYGQRSVEYWYSTILSKEEYEKEYAI